MAPIAQDAAVKERPILFSAPMVRAILEGRKTQTRRVVKPNRSCELADPQQCRRVTMKSSPADGVWAHFSREENTNHDDDIAPPLGQPGDRLWVRETFAVHGQAENRIYARGEGHAWGSPIYAADHGASWNPRCEGFTAWRPSIHMPRWASRITLEITGVRVERLHDIGKDGRKARDVLAEGITPEAIASNGQWYHVDDAPAITFGGLWESINGEGSWAANPWVWVYEFQRIDAE
jgi:hypothetical protein